MKQKDLALIAIIAILAVLISYPISKAIIGSPKQRRLKAEVVAPISKDFKQPDNRYFNSNSINPTKLIQIGDSTNPKPIQ